MAVIPGRGAQAALSGAAQLAARGASAATLEGNTAARDALVLSGAAPAGNTVDGTTSTGAVPVQTFDFLAGSAADSITATAGGKQSDGTLLTATLNNVTAVATAKDSVTLRPLAPGEVTVIANTGTASAQVFAAGTGTINGVATATGVALANGKIGLYFSIADGKLLHGVLA